MANQSKLKKKKNYDTNNIPLALDAIRGGMQIKEASAIFGIPRSTLSDKLHRKYAEDKNHPGMNNYKLLQNLCENKFNSYVLNSFSILVIKYCSVPLYMFYHSSKSYL